MSSNPYRIDGPALLSFSGGRTSARLLYETLNAYDGQLPPDMHVLFINTGDEFEKTLRFVHECGSRWSVPIHWAEYRNTEAGYEAVGLNSASRKGEPFDELIAKKANEDFPEGYVPNRGAPYCSIELKARTARDWCRGELGWQNWTVALGLRHDEQERVLGAIGRNHSGKDPWRNVMPLDTAKITKYGATGQAPGIMRFWLGPTERFDPAVDPATLPQGFDLGLFDYQGNCRFCWKKSEAKLRLLIRDALESGDVADLNRWIEREQRTGTAFKLTFTLESLRDLVIREPNFFEALDDDADEECGFTCFISDADQVDLAA